MPALDCAYKLQEYAGVARRKCSAGKATWPGRKQVWRRFDNGGKCAGDMISLLHETVPGEPLLRPVMRGGCRLAHPSLGNIRQHAQHNLHVMPDRLRRLDADASAYPVHISDALQALARAVDRRIAESEATE